MSTRRHAMGPVWEANHVWLIFVIVVAWTAYPTVLASITSTLDDPAVRRGDRDHPARHGVRAAGAGRERRRRDADRAASRGVVDPHPVRAGRGGGRDRVRARSRRECGRRSLVELAQCHRHHDRAAERRDRLVPGVGLPRRRCCADRRRSDRPGVPHARAAHRRRCGGAFACGADRGARGRQADLGRADERLGARPARRIRRRRRRDAVPGEQRPLRGRPLCRRGGGRRRGRGLGGGPEPVPAARRHRRRRRCRACHARGARHRGRARRGGPVPVARAAVQPLACRPLRSGPGRGRRPRAPARRGLRCRHGSPWRAACSWSAPR